MKTKILKLANLILAIFLFAFTITYTFAWFSDKIILATGPQGGSVGAYFAYGDGLSEDTAFGITDARHLYNLTALQNNGRFNDTTYYFEIAENTTIDMSTFNYCIAPIGNDEYPFKGVFNGNGGTISNLKVSTDKNKLRGGDPAKDDDYVFSYSVGLFGVTGDQSNVRNFILDNPQVEAVDSNTSYNSEATNKYAGLAIGCVANAASSIGVMGGTLSVQMSGYTTYNSILGDIGDLSSDVAGEIVIGESDTGYLVPQKIYNVAQSYYKSDVNYVLRDDGEGESDPHLKNNIALQSKSTISLGEMNLGAFAILNSDESSNDMYLDTERSVGYIYFNYNNISISGNISTVNQGLKNNELDPMYDATQLDENGNFKELTELETALRFGGGAKAVSSLQVVYEDNTLGSTIDNSISNCIAINITNNKGKIFVVGIGSNNESRTLGLYSANEVEITENSNSELSLSLGNSLGQLDMESYRNDGATDDRRAYATIFDINVAGTYYLASSSSGFSICYLAVEGVPAGQVSSGVLTDSAVSAVDFIYNGVSITQSEITGDTTIESFNFVYNGGLYTSTGGRVTISTATTSAAVVLYFDKRVNDFILNVSWYGTRPTSSNTTTTYINIADSPSENFAISDNTT